MASLLTLHENSAGPLQRVYEICLEEMNNLDDEINSVADLPRIPFTKAIKRNIEAAIKPAATSMEPETEVESNLPQISNNKRKRLTKRRKKQPSETESSTSLNHLRKKKRPKKATRDFSSSSSSSVSSLPDPSKQRVMCKVCKIWIEQYEMRQHEREHHQPTGPTLTRPARPMRQAKKNAHQMPEFEYY